MSEHEKQVLTPEEVVARRGNVRAKREEALYREVEAVLRATHHAAPHMNDSRAAQRTTDETADVTPRV